VSILRYGTVPILWNNDDVPELTPPVAWEKVLDEVQLAGFAGIELGTDFPRDPEVLKAALHDRGLRLSGAYYCPDLTDGANVAKALNEVNGFLDFLAAVGCDVLIAAAPVVPERARVAGRVSEAGARTLRDDEWQNLAGALNELGERCKARGLKLGFHNHAGTYIETPTELKKLMSLTDPQLVGLCLDTGHYVYGGGDPVQAIDTYRNRLVYVHLKDLDMQVKDTVVRHGLDFLEALRRHVFTELARGQADLHDVASKLLEIGYDGWIVAEQDTSKLRPLEAAQENRQALSILFEKAPQEA
jgi:inosose dehydratase